MLLQCTTTTSWREFARLLGLMILLGTASVGWTEAGADNAMRVSSTRHSPRLHVPSFKGAAPMLMAPTLDIQPPPLDKRQQAGEIFPNLSSTWRTTEPVDESGEARSALPFPIRWRESRGIANPDIVALVRNYRRIGLPLVHLWESDTNLLAIGLNSHGIPGIYFTRHVAD